MKKTDLKSEVAANIVDRNGFVTVGVNKPLVYGDMVGGDPDRLENETGKVGHIHTHPTAKPIDVMFDKGGLSHLYTLDGGKPSPDDRNETTRLKSDYRFVMVDEKNVYLCAKGEQTIVIPRR